VATGAATVEPETVVPTEPTAEPTPPEVEAPAEPTAETGRLHPEPPEPLSEPDVEGPKRNPLLTAGALAAIAVAVVLGFVLTSSGGGGDGTTAADPTTTPADSTEKEQTQEEPKEKPEPRLSTSALVGQADEICTEARSSYEASKAQFPDGETEAGMSVEFAEQLVANSGRQVKKMSQLNPPKSKEEEYREYLQLRKDVARMDQRALAAAEEENPVAYVQTYESRGPIDEQLQQVSDEIGFEVCSNNG